MECRVHRRDIFSVNLLKMLQEAALFRKKAAAQDFYYFL